MPTNGIRDIQRSGDRSCASEHKKSQKKKKNTEPGGVHSITLLHF